MWWCADPHDGARTHPVDVEASQGQQQVRADQHPILRIRKTVSSAEEEGRILKSTLHVLGFISANRPGWRHVSIEAYRSFLARQNPGCIFSGPKEKLERPGSSKRWRHWFWGATPKTAHLWILQAPRYKLKMSAWSALNLQFKKIKPKKARRTRRTPPRLENRFSDTPPFFLRNWRLEWNFQSGIFWCWLACMQVKPMGE